MKRLGDQRVMEPVAPVGGGIDRTSLSRFVEEASDPLL